MQIHFARRNVEIHVNTQSAVVRTLVPACNFVHIGTTRITQSVRTQSTFVEKTPIEVNRKIQNLVDFSRRCSPVL